MRLFTPEIAWHETLPIYSCDLQPQTSTAARSSASSVPPLADLTDCPPYVTQPVPGTNGNWTRLATAGGDTVVRLWRVQLDWVMHCSIDSLSLHGVPAVPTKKRTDSKTTVSEHLTYLASLKRHEKPVNVVRWSPSGSYLASAGDDLFIVIWCNQPVDNASTQNGPERTDINDTCKEADDEDESAVSVEHWVPCRCLRRHLEDIYDVCWSPDSQALISGSVDHSVIVWQLDLVPSTVEPPVSVSTGASAPSSSSSSTPSSSGSGNTKCLILRDHKHYVQGVAWDPLGFYVASLSGDRACRIYRTGTKNCLAHVSKCGKQRLFQDDSWKSFFRRLTFSPDGLLLVCPSGNLEDAAFACTSISSVPTSSADGLPGPIPAVAPQHAAHIFLRSNFTRPVSSLPTGTRPVVTVRFCPQPFQLRISSTRDSNEIQTRSLFDLPYRWLFCLVLEDGVLFYDTQQSTPFAQVSQAHYQALNDAAWSDDGHLLVTCSTDGYCSMIRFARGELGTPYRGPIGLEAVVDRKVTQPDPMVAAPPTLTGVTEIAEVVAPPAISVAAENVAPGSETKPPPSASEQGNIPDPSAESSSTCVGATKKRRVPFLTLSAGPDKKSLGESRDDSTNQSDSTPAQQPNEAKTHAEKSEPVRKRRVSFVTLTSDPSISNGHDSTAVTGPVTSPPEPEH